MKKEELRQSLVDYFNIGDSYAYSLTRCKEAFSVGTMTLDDFEEFDDELIDDIVEYINNKFNIK